MLRIKQKKTPQGHATFLKQIATYKNNNTDTVTSICKKPVKNDINATLTKQTTYYSQLPLLFQAIIRFNLDLSTANAPFSALIVYTLDSSETMN